MTPEDDDPLARLQAALKSTPVPDGAAKAASLRLAEENFARLQGSRSPARPISDRPQRTGFLMGVTDMLKALTGKPLLAATTSAAALCLGLVVILPLAEHLPLPRRGLGEGRVVEPAAAPAPDTAAPVQKTAPAPAAEVAEQTPAPEPAKPQVSSDQPREKALADAGTTGAGADGTLQAMSTETVPEEAPVGQVTEAPMMDMAADEPLARDEAAPKMELAAPAPAPQASAKRRAVAAAAPTSAAESFAMAEPIVAPQIPLSDTETYANAPANPVKVTAEEPVSTFSIDVDTASYAVVRSSLDAGMMPDPASVRVEEMINYFPYAYPAPEGDAAFRPTITVMQTPWNPGTRLVHIGIQGALPAIAERPPLNLVFLVDTSGSMMDSNKLPLLKQSLALMLPQLRPEDQVAIVAYAGSAGEVLAPTPAGERAKILSALDGLEAGGSTAGAEGIALAYQVAKGMSAKGEVSRVLLATDGDFNVGIDDPEALKTYIAEQRKSGVYLSVLGFGRGNLDDATMQALAQNGNGTASYIDTLTEARKVLVDQLSGALFPIADNVKIQIEWNPAEVAEYRLIGYETRALRREDFNNDKVDAGDIGAGTSVTAIYEVTAPGSAAIKNTPLRYGEGEAAPASEDGAGELGFLRLRSVAPGASTSTLQETPILPETAAPSEDARFAVAIAGFGQLLTGATYLGDWGWDQAIALAVSARGEDPYGYRAEAVTLMRLAQSLSAR